MAKEVEQTQASKLEKILQKMEQTNSWTTINEDLVELATVDKDGKFWLGVNLFLAGADHYDQARKIFEGLHEENYEDGDYFLALLNYPLFSKAPNLPLAVDLWTKAADDYGKFWLAQYSLDPQYGPAEYNQAWEYLQNIPEDDSAAMGLRAYLMANQAYYFPAYDDNSEINDYRYWWQRSINAKKSAPLINSKGADYKGHIKAYINQHYGKEYPVTVESAEQVEQEQEILAQPSPYRGISFIIGGIFLVIFVLLTIIHVLR